MTHKPLDAFRLAVESLGDVSSDEIALHIQQTFGMKFEPKIIPILRASLQDWQNLSRHRAPAN